MSKWKKMILGDITDWFSGGTPSKQIDYYWSGDIPWISAKTLIGTRVSESEITITKEGLLNGSRLSKKGDLLLLVRGSGLFKSIPIAIVEKPVAFNQDIKAIRLKKGFEYISPWFLLYWFYSNTRILYGIMEETGIGAGKFDIELLKNLTIDIPPENIIQEITKTCKSIDDKLELLRQQSQTLEELAQTIFKRWFVEFNFPDSTGKPYKLSGGKMIESELGKIPEDWQVGVLSDIAEITIGRTPPRIESEWFSVNPKDVKWASIKDMGNTDVFINDTSECLTKKAIENFRIPKIPKLTTILSFKLTVGRVAIAMEEMLSNEAIAHIHLHESFDCYQFSYLLLKNYNYDLLGSTSSIATAVNSKSIKNMEIIIPNSEIIKDFDICTVGIFKKILINTMEIQTLIKLRDTLLPKLMSGEIQISD